MKNKAESIVFDIGKLGALFLTIFGLLFIISSGAEGNLDSLPGSINFSNFLELLGLAGTLTLSAALAALYSEMKDLQEKQLKLENKSELQISGYEVKGNYIELEISNYGRGQAKDLNVVMEIEFENDNYDIQERSVMLRKKKEGSLTRENSIQPHKENEKFQATPQLEVDEKIGDFRSIVRENFEEGEEFEIQLYLEYSDHFRDKRKQILPTVREFEISTSFDYSLEEAIGNTKIEEIDPSQIDISLQTSDASIPGRWDFEIDTSRIETQKAISEGIKCNIIYIGEKEDIEKENIEIRVINESKNIEPEINELSTERSFDELYRGSVTWTPNDIKPIGDPKNSPEGSYVAVVYNSEDKEKVIKRKRIQEP